MIDALEIGRRIKERREELDLTQDQLGKRLWLNKSTIQRYETGSEKYKAAYTTIYGKRARCCT